MSRLKGLGGMKLKKLSIEQIEKVYTERMKEDFPPAELKPLGIIKQCLDKDAYECLGLFDGESMQGYAFLLKRENDYLIDYLAVCPECRNEGIGGKLLGRLGEYLAEAESIIAEVEDPAFEEDDEKRVLCKRRMEFYYRNGFEDTGVKAVCFGVHFILIETGVNAVHSKEQIKELYLKHYRFMLPDEVFSKNVEITE